MKNLQIKIGKFIIRFGWVSDLLDTRSHHKTYQKWKKVFYQNKPQK